MIPTQCNDCLNFLREDKCRALVKLQQKPCFARTTDKAKMDKRRKQMVEYERNYLSAHGVHKDPLDEDSETTEEDPEEAESEPPVDNRTPAQRLADIPTSEIMGVMYEEMHRGSGKGGGEKEKAPNKKKQGNKKVIEVWDGYGKWK
jgi:hypothetical protein